MRSLTDLNGKNSFKDTIHSINFIYLSGHSERPPRATSCRIRDTLGVPFFNPLLKRHYMTSAVSQVLFLIANSRRCNWFSFAKPKSSTEKKNNKLKNYFVKNQFLCSIRGRMLMASHLCVTFKTHEPFFQSQKCLWKRLPFYYINREL